MSFSGKQMHNHLFIQRVLCAAHSVMSDSLQLYIACQAPLSMEFSKPESWSGLPFPTPWDLPDPRMEHPSPALTGRFFTTAPPGKPIQYTLTKCLLDI